MGALKSRGLGDVYKRQGEPSFSTWMPMPFAIPLPAFSFSKAPMVAVVLVARVPENEVLMLAYPVSLRPPLHCRSILKSFPPAVVPTPFRSVRRMEPTSTFIFFPLSTEQEGETTVMALALR